MVNIHNGFINKIVLIVWFVFFILQIKYSHQIKLLYPNKNLKNSIKLNHSFFCSTIPLFLQTLILLCQLNYNQIFLSLLSLKLQISPHFNLSHQSEKAKHIFSPKDHQSSYIQSEWPIWWVTFGPSNTLKFIFINNLLVIAL